MNILREDYRSHLQMFYNQLNLAPPYHSIEKAVQHLSNNLKTKPETLIQTLLKNPSQKWLLYEKIFEASGLSLKHRGIIRQLARTWTNPSKDSESLRFLNIFTDTSTPHSVQVK